MNENVNVNVKRNIPLIFFRAPQSCFDFLDPWNIYQWLIAGLIRGLSVVIWLAAARLAPESAMWFLAGGGGGGGGPRKPPPPQGTR